MQQVLQWVDVIWNIRFLKGYRSALARFFLVGISAYQFLSTAPQLAFVGARLPDVPSELYVALVAYFGLKLEQFAKEHNS